MGGPGSGRRKKPKVEIKEIRPQPGPQEQFLSSDADIVFYGGAAGGGKSFALLLEPLRHRNVKGFGAAIFRRTYPQIMNEGALWDESCNIYPMIGGKPKVGSVQWNWQSGSTVSFNHLTNDETCQNYQGAAICLLCFDELTHFTEYQFFYMLSRNRSTCGVKPYVRCTTNPDAESWVADFIDWWIGEDGYPIPARAGVVRWFVRFDKEVHWADTREELLEQFKHMPPEDVIPKSFTFIPANLEDNPALTSKDPGYRANLLALDVVERERLLRGNWKIRPTAGLYFPRSAAMIVDAAPDRVIKLCRAWDKAATLPSKSNPDPDYTCGIKMGRLADGRILIMGMELFRLGPAGVRKRMRNTAEQDGKRVTVCLFKDPAAAGKIDLHDTTKLLDGFAFWVLPASKGKLVMAGPLSSQWEQGNVVLLRGPWNEKYLQFMERFPEGHDDPTDASSLGYRFLSRGSGLQTA